MKYCEEYAALLDLFVDGELPPDEMERVRDHLETCSGCRAYVDDALTIRAGFPDVEETVVPEGFAEGVMQRIREDADGKIVELKRRGVRRWLGTAAALAACCALVVLVRTGGPGSEKLAAPVESSAVSDCAASGEAGVEPQAAADMAQTEEETPMAVENTAGDMNRQKRSALAEAPSGVPETAMDAAASPTAEAVKGVDDAFYEDIALCLTAEEAGDLLDGFTPEEETASERRYTLSMAEYETLLEALGRWEKLPETPEMRFQVVVTGPSK